MSQSRQPPTPAFSPSNSRMMTTIALTGIPVTLLAGSENYLTNSAF